MQGRPVTVAMRCGVTKVAETADPFQGVAVHGEGNIVCFKGPMSRQSFQLDGHPVAARLRIPMTGVVVGARELEATLLTLGTWLRMLFQNVHGVVPVPGREM